MTDAFEFAHVVENQTEFRVAFGRGKEPVLNFVKIVQSLRNFLNSAVSRTIEEMLAIDTGTGSAEDYDPSSIYEGKGRVFIPMDSLFAVKARYLHDAQDVPSLPDPIKHLPSINLYMARLVDSNGKLLTAVKGVGDFRRRVRDPKLIGWMGEGLGIETEERFELYDDFDFLVDDSGVQVYRPKAFETVCNLADIIRDSVSQNVEYLTAQIPFIDFAPFLENPSIRNARAFASIRGEGRYQRVEQDMLCGHCDRLELQYEIVEGRIRIGSESQDTFLRLINRQVLGIEMVKGELETYLAASRRPFGSVN